MFPKSLLFAFVATSLFLANVGVEASPKPNGPDAFDSYPSDRFRMARVDKRCIPSLEFQEYYAKANGDGRAFVRRNDDDAGGNGHQGSDCSPGQTRCHHPPTSNKGSLPAAAAANLEKRSPLGMTMVKGYAPIGVPTDKTKKPIPEKTAPITVASDNYQGAPKSITITSSLSTTPADRGFVYICSLPFSSYDGIFRQGDDSRGSSVQVFMNEAQKFAKCTWLSSTNVHCVKQGGEEVRDEDKTTWWQRPICKSCSDAGGKNRNEIACPHDSNGAKTMQGEKEGEKD